MAASWYQAHLNFLSLKKKQKQKQPYALVSRNDPVADAEVVGVTMVIISLRFPVLAHSQTSKSNKAGILGYSVTFQEASPQIPFSTNSGKHRRSSLQTRDYLPGHPH